MSDMLDYYKQYYDKGGEYTMEKGAAGTSRPEQIISWLRGEVKPSSKILDVGCGDMYLSKLAPEYDWVGVDINIDKAPANKAYAHDLMKEPYPFEAGSFDAVVCSEVLEHVWDMRIVHKQTFNLLSSGGVYIISTPNFKWIDNLLSWHNLITYDPAKPWTMEHIRHYTPEIHQKHLTATGFKIIDMTGADAHYSQFFSQARIVLKAALTQNYKLTDFESDANVDRLLGKMFPEFNHTIMLMGRKQ